MALGSKHVTNMPAVTNAMVEQYRRDGFLVMRNMVTGGETERLKRGVLQICRNETESTFRGQIFEPPASDQEALRRYLAVHAPDKLSDTIGQFVRHHGPMHAVLRRLMGSADIRYYSTMLFIKSPGDPGHNTHQDEFYIPTQNHSLTTTWVPLGLSPIVTSQF